MQAILSIILVYIPFWALATPSCRKDATMKVDPFDLFPPVRQWKRVAKTIANPKQIDRYVEYYLAPFRDIQKAERNRTIHLDIIKGSLLKALQLSIRTVGELKVTRKEYERRLAEDYSAATRRALTIFEGSEAKKMAPVLTPRIMRRFMLQRLDDMMWGTQKYSEMQAERRRFIRNAKHIYRRIQKAELFLMRHVIEKTLDLEEVKRSLVHDLKRFHHDKETAQGPAMEQIIWKIKGTGDDACRPLPAIFLALSSSLIIGITMAM